jgi:hypothetical protein
MAQKRSALSKISLHAALESSPAKHQRADCLSSASTEAGFGPDHTAPGDTANWAFTADGFDPGGSQAPYWDISTFLTAGEITALRSEGHFRCHLSSGFNKDDISAVTYITSTSGSVGGWIEWQADGDFKNRMQSDHGTVAGVDGGEIHLRSAAIPATGSDLDVYYNASHMRLFWNGLLVDQQPAPAFDTDFANWYIGGLTTVTSDYSGETIADCQLQATAPILQEDRVRILHLGDSLTTQGGAHSGFYSPLSASVKLPWIPDNTTQGSGYQSDGTTAETPDLSFGDAGMLPSIYRALGKKYIYPFDSNKNYAQAGGDVSDAITQVTNISGWTPTDAICCLGTNDVSGLTADATFQTNYRDLIQDLWELGAQRVYVVQIPTLENNVAYQSSTYRDKRDALNAIISALPGWAGENGYGDFVTYIGLPSSITSDTGYDTSLFKTAPNVHFSITGSYLYGTTIGDRVARTIEAPESRAHSIIGPGVIGNG